MAVAIAAGTPVIGNQVPSVTATVPGNTLGDISVMAVFMYGSGVLVLNTPSGWTSLGFVASAGSTVAGGFVIYREWQPGDPTTLVFAPAQGGSARIVVNPFRLRGAQIPLAPSATQSWGPINAGVNVPAPSVVAPAAGDMLVTVHGARNSGTGGATATWTPPSGMTELMDTTSTHASSANVYDLVSYKQLTAAGATGVQNAQCTIVVRGGSWSFIVPKKAVVATTLRMKGGVPVTTRYKGQP